MKIKRQKRKKLMKFLTLNLMALCFLQSNITLASPNTEDCDKQALKLTKAIIKAEKLYSGTLHNTEAKVNLTSARDQSGNVYQTVDIIWGIGPSQKIVSKYLWEEGNCTTLISVDVK